MRLLNVHTLEFSWFPDKDAPPYAIASHRWATGKGDEGETSFLDLSEKRNTNTVGYRKTESFAKYVREQIPSLSWLWTDTCCINKQDAQETSEAINSMYRWYQNSAICVAYLADVAAIIDMDSFAASEWFRRGWTLQELLAPRTVIFLTKDWQVIGHKKIFRSGHQDLTTHIGPSLKNMVSEITKISEAVLSGSQRVEDVGIADRLEWIRARETTIEEDRWYCLFGIFDVAIGANYGEGADKARRRLMAEFQKVSASIESLPVASGAAFDDSENEHVPGCLPGTRVDVLRNIYAWADEANGPCMFWLAGMAGTGKTTIFKTVMQSFQDQGKLAASFAFRRGEGDRGHAKKFITTIAKQVSRHVQHMRDALSLTLEQDPDIVHKVLREQFQQLLLAPLKNGASIKAQNAPWIIGIDALDECHGEDDMVMLLDLLSQLKAIQSSKFRIFITSRPAHPIRLTFKTMSKSIHRDARLEDVPEDTVAGDIRTFLRHNLTIVWKRYSTLNDYVDDAPTWPSEQRLDCLAKMSQPLFIFAATVCRLLSEPDEDLEILLEDILEYDAMISPLGRTYGPVLNRLLHDKTPRQRIRTVDAFKKIVGGIIMLAEPLPLQALGNLIGVEPKAVTLTLHRLHSVLDVPPADAISRPIRPLHRSFRDFLTDDDSRDKQPFWIDKSLAHRNLADACIRLLLEPDKLKRDVCKVGKPGVRRTAVDTSYVKSHIDVDVSYACCHWAFHVVQSGDSVPDGGHVHKFLQVKLLEWLEALSWLSRLSVALASIMDILAIDQCERGTQTTIYLEDARRFVLYSRHIINIAPLQVYHSAIMFAPTSSIVRRTFDQQVPHFWARFPPIRARWSAVKLRLELEEDMRAAALSADGTLLAAFVHRCESVHIWNVLTGERLHDLSTELGQVTGLIFIGNTEIASKTSSQGIQVWSVETGRDVFTWFDYHDIELWVRRGEGFEDHLAREVTGRRAGYYERLLRDKVFEERRTSILDFIQRLKLRDDGAQELLLQFFAEGSGRPGDEDSGRGEDFPAEMISRSTNLHRTRVAIEQEGLQHFPLSSDDATSEKRLELELGQYVSRLDQIAIVDERLTVTIWDGHTGEKLSCLSPPLPCQHVSGLHFSPCGKKLVVIVHGYSIMFWELESGRPCIRIAEHDANIESVFFSSDSSTLATVSLDGTICIWDLQYPLQIFADQTPTNDHVTEAVTTSDSQHCTPTPSDFFPHEPHSLIFSCDFAMLACASRDGFIQLFNVQTGRAFQSIDARDTDQTVKRYEDTLVEIAFAPDGRHLISSNRRRIQLWIIATGRLLYDFTFGGLPLALAVHGDEVLIEVHKSWVLSDRTYHRVVFPRDQGSSPTHLPGDEALREHFKGTEKATDSDVTLAIQGDWIEWRGEKILWLPTEHRASISASHGHTLVIAKQSGEVVFYRLRDDIAATLGQESAWSSETSSDAKTVTSAQSALSSPSWTMAYHLREINRNLIGEERLDAGHFFF